MGGEARKLALSQSAALTLKRAGRVVLIALLGLPGCSDGSASTGTDVGASFADELSAEVFTLDRSCAYDFITGDEAGHWLLNIGNGWGELSPGRHDISRSGVYGTVTVGEDLWANHCNDVVLPSTPQPIPADEWRIVEGWFVMPDVATRSGPSITITLRDLVDNTVQLGWLEGWLGWSGGLWPVGVSGSFDVPLGVFAFDDERVGSVSPFR